MIQVLVEQFSHLGRVTIRCRCCSTKSVYPDGAAVQVYEHSELGGRTFRMVVIDAASGARLHDCLIVRVWECALCDTRTGVLPSRRGRLWTKCKGCGEELRQVEVPKGPLVPRS